MRELIKTNNPALISFVEAVLRDAGIEVLVFDGNASIVEGSIGILPRRIMVADDDHPRAIQVVRAAGLAQELYDGG